MKKNQNNLLLTSFLQSLGTAMVGVFFPFLVAKAFHLEIWQIFIWLAGLNFAGVLLVYPLNKVLNKRISIKRTLQIGLFCLAMFYILLSFSRENSGLIGFATLFLVIGIYLFWPNYNFIAQHSTKDGQRGKFLGSAQSLMVGANILAPLISGFLLQNNLEIWILGITAFFFGSAIFFLEKVDTPNYKLPDFPKMWRFFSRDFARKTIGRLTFLEGIQSGTLLTVWPVFLKSVLVNFVQMGSLVSLSAIVEIISAKISGHLIDKKSAKKTLKYSAIARFFDLGIRGLIFFVPTPLMAGIASFFAGFLGPVFNISYSSRMMEIAETYKKREWEFFIVREWILSGMRGLTYLFAGFLVFFWGVKSLVILIFIAALASFGLRKT